MREQVYRMLHAVYGTDFGFPNPDPNSNCQRYQREISNINPRPFLASRKPAFIPIFNMGACKCFARRSQTKGLQNAALGQGWL